MTEREKTKPDFTMIGSRDGVPSLDDIVRLVKHLTGQPPSEACIAEIKAQMQRDGYPQR